MGLKAIDGNPVLNAIGVQSASNLDTSLANNRALLLPHWRLALAKVRNNSASARVLGIGDSTMAGYGGSGSPYQNSTSFLARLAQLLSGPVNAAGASVLPSAAGLAVPPVSVTDSRWAAGTGWSFYGAFGAADSAAYTASAGASGALVFTPGVKCDSFYVYYAGGSGLGSVTATATGGSGVAINTNSTAGIFRSALISAASASSSNTLSLAGITTNSVFIVAIEPVLSSVSQVLVGNAGVGGSTSSQWNGNAPYGGVNLIEANAPDLTVISLGINDAGGSTPPATLQVNIQALITAAQASGDVMLSTWPPSDSTPYTTYQPTYLRVFQALAQSNNCLLLDLYSRWAGTWNSAIMFDTLHPNNYGYWDWGAACYNLLGDV